MIGIGSLERTISYRSTATAISARLAGFVLGTLAATTYLTTSYAAAAPLPSNAPASLDELLRPAGIDHVTLSPSGTRVALLFNGQKSDSDLLVLDQQGGQAKPILATHLTPPAAIAAYRWLSDDFIALYYASPDEEFNQFAIADLNKHAIHLQDPFTQIVKAPWGDADHILLSETGAENCHNHAPARCLIRVDLKTGLSNQISEPFTMLPVAFLAVSPTEIYATGRDTHGIPHDFMLEMGMGRWREVAPETVAQRRDELQREQPASADITQRSAQAGMPGALPVWTEPDHTLVGLIGHAPQRAFFALYPRLDGLQALLEQQYSAERVQISGLNQSLTRGMVQISGPDQPPLYLFFNDSGGLSEYSQLEPNLSAAALGHTHIERGWADGMPVAVTLPPTGVTPSGALVEPVITAPEDAEEPLEAYDGLREAFAQAGIIVIRALVPAPTSFPNSAAGGEWRQAEAARFRQVLTHVRGELAAGKPVCLYGTGDDGVLALAWSGLAPVDCTVSVGARLDPQAMTKPIKLFEETDRQNVHLAIHGGSISASAIQALSAVTVGVSNVQLHRELPALYGQPGNDQLADPGQWAPQLPTRVMLAYDMQQRIQQEYAAESAAMREAIRRAGKHLTYFVDATVRTDDIQSRERMLSAVIDYIRQ